VKPVLVLIGGATGTGKSTVATRVAQELGITRLASTDVVRQTMRAFFAPELMPSLHVSSFEGEPVIETFVEQTEAVLAGVRATFDRALEEGWSTVVEGVHLVPGMLDVPAGAVAVQCTLAISSLEAHARHFALRAEASEGLRPVERYLARLDDIRRVQAFVVDASRTHGVPVIENRGIEATVAEVLARVRGVAAAELERV
jgi:2-phosphoglycerate kinase